MQPIVVRWPGGEHACRLGLGELRTIQQKTDCGPELLVHRINFGLWKVDELREIIRNGLIGGGMPHVEALKLVDHAFEDTPVISFKVPAQEIMAAYLFGPPDEAPGEVEPVQPTPESDRKTANGPSE